MKTPNGEIGPTPGERDQKLDDEIRDREVGADLLTLKDLTAQWKASGKRKEGQTFAEIALTHHLSIGAIPEDRMVEAHNIIHDYLQLARGNSDVESYVVQTLEEIDESLTEHAA